MILRYRLFGKEIEEAKYFYKKIHSYEVTYNHLASEELNYIQIYEFKFIEEVHPLKKNKEQVFYILKDRLDIRWNGKNLGFDFGELFTDIETAIDRAKYYEETKT